ncbi:MAG: NAD(P)H-hydrate dehydratase [Candidatus Omnitrophota bacterium]
MPTRLLLRRSESNKGDYGHIFVLAGSRAYSGAALLCAEAAMRSGAGLVTLGIPRGINNAIIKAKLKEVMTLPLPQTAGGALAKSAYAQIKSFAKKIDILVIGPGLSRDKSTQSLTRKIARHIDKPMVIDADGLNALAGHLSALLPAKGCRQPVVLTPHPKEMARLLGATVDEIQRNRGEIAREFSQSFKLTLALKGHNTVVSSEKGRLYINKTGNPGMSSAGSGDVLTGIIAAFLGQGLEGFSAAKYGVYLHGLAGDLAAKEKTQISLIASDIIAKIPEAIKMSG